MPWVCLHKGIPHIAIQKGKEKVNLTYSGGEVCAIKNQVELSTQKKKLLTLLESSVNSVTHRLFKVTI